MSDFTITDEQAAEGDAAKAALNEHPLVQNSSMVCDKRPPTYDRRWHLHVCYTDWSTAQFSGPDNGPTAPAAVYREALRSVERRALVDEG